MNRSQLKIVLAVVAVAVGAIVLLLVTGGSDEPAGGVVEEPSGDVVIGEGSGVPSETDLADIQAAKVTSAGGKRFVFSATFGAPIPKKMGKKQTFSFRWDVTSPDGEGFIVSGNLDVGANVAILSTGGRYGASSLDDSFPGKMEINGSTWTVTINGGKIKGWPSDFTWKLKTSIDAVQGDPQSARAEDHAPDEGFGTVTRA